jgi:pimeloyl-ACP methyl ester carboxylesterase
MVAENALAKLSRFPIVYVRGYGGTTTGINTLVNDAFYGFNEGATHVRIDGDGDPAFYQYEGPLLRLMTEYDYKFLVHGDQRQLLTQAGPALDSASIWIHRFYDSAATTFTAQKKHGLLAAIENKIHHEVTADGFDLEQAAADLYELIELVLARTEAPKVYLLAHSMGGLIARCMIQKVCGTPRPGPGGGDRRTGKEIVAKLFTFGTPHGGIVTNLGPVNTAMELFGPAGADIFSPPKMYGYLTPGKKFGDEPPHSNPPWDPREMPADKFDVNDVFCIVGTDPVDYGASRIAVGPKSDGLVRIENAYVKGAHRAFIYKSHSGAYGEVNSEEAYQNLHRFLFGRWQVDVNFTGLQAEQSRGPTTWQADMRMAIRGLPVVVSEQQAAHWCPIILTAEATASGADSPDTPVPLVSTFLLEKTPPQEGQPADLSAVLSRYVVTLRVFSVVDHGGMFDFSDHLEQVADWSDSLIVDVGPAAPEPGTGAWVGWNTQLDGAINSFPRMPHRLDLEQTPGDDALTASVPLPDTARALPIFSPSAALHIRVHDRSGDAAR